MAGNKLHNLTPEQEEFYRVIRLRAVTNGMGQPWLAYAVWQLKPMAAPGMETMGVTKDWVVLIDFDYLMPKGIEEAGRYLNHEIWHVLRDHHGRFAQLAPLPKRQIHNHKVWNIAGDMVINHDLKTSPSKFTDGYGLAPAVGIFPGEGRFSSYPVNKLTEEYYDMLMKDDSLFAPCKSCQGTGKKQDQKDSQDKDSKDQQGSKGQDQQDGQDSGEQDSNDSGDQPGGDQDGQEGQGNQPGGDQDGQGDQPGDAQGQGGGAGDQHGNGSGAPCPDCQGSGRATEWVPCGSGSGNSLGDWEREAEGQGKDSDESEGIRRRVASDIKDYAAKQRGKMPANYEMWADEILAPEPVDWRSLLRAQVKKSVGAWQRGKVDYVRSRPNRRQPAKGIIYPAMRAPKPRIAIGVDTSGSNVHNLGLVTGQIGLIMKQATANPKDIAVFSVDAASDKPQHHASLDAVAKSFTGGGGTDMRVAFDVFHDLSKKGEADVSILLTDLETPWPANNPRINGRVIVVGIVTDKVKNSSIDDARAALSPWADLILIDDAMIQHHP